MNVVEPKLRVVAAMDLEQRVRELGSGIIAQEMIGRGPDPAQIDVLEPGSERLDSLAQLRVGDRMDSGLGHFH